MNTTQIGCQVWTTENLRVFSFRNGDPIPIVSDNDEWSGLESAAVCINPETEECYYNWYAVNDPRGLAPEGFHVPSDPEWDELVRACGDEAGLCLKSNHWDGTNSSGFDALPCGHQDLDNGYEDGYFDQGYGGYWWTSSPSGQDAWYRNLDSGSSIVYRYTRDARYGFSVRLIKD